MARVFRGIADGNTTTFYFAYSKKKSTTTLQLTPLVKHTSKEWKRMYMQKSPMAYQNSYMYVDTISIHTNTDERRQQRMNGNGKQIDSWNFLAHARDVPTYTVCVCVTRSLWLAFGILPRNSICVCHSLMQSETERDIFFCFYQFWIYRKSSENNENWKSSRKCLCGSHKLSGSLLRKFINFKEMSKQESIIFFRFRDERIQMDIHKYSNNS